ncbi:MAG TPA: hypothetical protein VEM93_10080 [Actinomycetota bacterium]|nr:hypothetical protein [Actinomycetota bacterium]
MADRADERPRRGLDLRTPSGNQKALSAQSGRVERRNVLGGLIHEYGWAA